MCFFFFFAEKPAARAAATPASLPMTRGDKVLKSLSKKQNKNLIAGVTVLFSCI